MQVITIALDIMLFATTALIFSITILCLLLYRRTGDRYISGFLGILIPLTVQTGLNFINTYLGRIDPSYIDTGKIYSSFALMGTYISLLCSTSIILFLSRYLTDLIPVPAEKRKLGHRIIYILSIAYLLACLFAVFFINKGDWISAFHLVLEDLFLTGSLLLSIHGITALFYIRNAANREHENLLRGISTTFLPLIPFYILDRLFLGEMSFKLTYISYTIFCVSIYFFISRHYIRKYEPDPESLEPEYSKLEREGFSKREIEVINLVVTGKTNKEIGEELFISVNTVKTHVKNIYSKFNISNRIQLIQKTRNL